MLHSREFRKRSHGCTPISIRGQDMRDLNTLSVKNPHLIDAFRLKTGERIYLSDLEKIWTVFRSMRS